MKRILLAILILIGTSFVLADDRFIDDVMQFSTVTQSPTTGLPANADSGTVTFGVFESTDAGSIVTGSMTQRTATGSYVGSITLSTANGFENGKSYAVIATATFSGTAYSDTIAQFRVMAAPGTQGGPWLLGANTGTFSLSGRGTFTSGLALGGSLTTSGIVNTGSFSTGSLAVTNGLTAGSASLGPGTFTTLNVSTLSASAGTLTLGTITVNGGSLATASVLGEVLTQVGAIRDLQLNHDEILDGINAAIPDIQNGATATLGLVETIGTPAGASIAEDIANVSGSIDLSLTNAKLDQIIKNLGVGR